MIRVRFRRSADWLRPLSPLASGLPFKSILAPRSCQTDGVSDRQHRLAKARLYLVCDAQPDEFVRAALDGGVDLVQLRCKDASDAEVARAAARFKAVCSEHGALFIVNDRPDLALAADADGVHVGQDDAPVAEARRLLGEERIVGLSTHSPAQVDAAREQPVDYIAVGPVHETPTKPGRPAVGLELVRYAAAKATVPFFAIGGINPDNVDAVASAGAERIVVVRALTQAHDPGDVAQRLRAAVSEARPQVGSAQS
jgi:thiamine-phosphate pyrophosphorylase